MAYLDSSPPPDPSFLQTLARALGLGSQPSPSPDRATLAAALSGQPSPAPPGTHYARLPGPPLLLPGGDDGAAAPQPPPRQVPGQVPAQAPPAAPSGQAMPMRGSVADIAGVQPSALAPAAVMPPSGAPAAAQSIVVPGYETKGPLTRAQVTAAPDDDKTMPAEEDWDAAAAKQANAGGAGGAASSAVATVAGDTPAAIYEKALKSRYDQQEQLYNRFNAQAAAAKTPEVARIFAQQAAAALAEGNRILDEQQALLKPGTRTLSDAELTAAERAAGGEWQQSATGERSQVSGTAGDTTRAPNAEEAARIAATGQDPKNYMVKDGAPVRIPGTEPRAAERKEMRVIGHDAFGGETYGIFDPTTGQVTPYKVPEPANQAAAMPAQIQELGLPNADAGQGDKTPSIPLPLEQQALLAQVDPHIRATVESILQGRLGLPKITAGRGNPLPLAITQAVLTVNPQFDANMNQNQLLARKAFNAGGSNNTPGQLILNSDSALDHFVPLVEASDALPNYGSFLGPAVEGAQRAIPGNLAGEDFKKKVAALTSAATPASAETMKYLAGTTGGGEAEREQLIKSFSDIGGSPASRRESVVNYLDDMLAKKAELQNQWRTAMGPNAPAFPVISDSARNSVIKMGYGDLLTKYGLDKGSANPPGVPTRSAPWAAPVVPISGQPRKGTYVPGQGIKWQ